MLNAMSRKAREVEQKICMPNLLTKLSSLTTAVATMNAQPQHPHPMTAQYYLSELATKEETEVIITVEDFERALQTLVPSVSQSDMEHYVEVQKEFAWEEEKV